MKFSPIRTVFHPDGDSGGNDAGGTKSGKGNDLDGQAPKPDDQTTNTSESGGSDTKVPQDPKTGEIEAVPPGLPDDL
ncbi:MAG: hypothetical protein SX243_20100 [Acidobacteriota bacterium]|nr:hypothetical protein [Acidobacteriota bacterium]